MSPDTSSQAENQKRRTERILLRLPIEVKGTLTNGKPFREKTHSVAINRHGARIILNHDVPPESRLTITNLQNSLSTPFRVVERVGKPKGEQAEWGVECLQPELNFWGIFFPPLDETHAAEDLIDTLLECAHCHARELAQLTLPEYQAIVTRTSLHRACATCQGKTEWTFGFVEGDPREAYQGPAAVPAPATTNARDRRGAKRVPVKLPVRIRVEEIGETENLSHSGVCFSSNLVLKVGDSIMVTVGYEPGCGNQEVTGRVVWRQEIVGSTRFLYGVQLEKST